MPPFPDAFVDTDRAGRPWHWWLADAELDGWLAARDAPALAARLPVLADTGPAETGRLRDEFGLAGPVVVVAVDGQPVWLVTGEQLRALNHAHGREPVRLRPPSGLDGMLGYASAGEPVTEPSPDDWPDRVFGYGTLCPGGSAWSLAEPMLAGAPRPARLPGTLYDTGLGYPGLLLDAPTGDESVPGWLLPLRSPATSLPELDEYEGPEYRRVRVACTDGTICWTYQWCEPVAGMARLPAGWPGIQPHPPGMC